MIEVFVDADACPVKDEVYVVATRYGVRVAIVANARIAVPEGFGAQSIVVVTADIPLAARCLDKGARAIGTTGRVFDEDSIGGQLATRDLKAELREAGVHTGGPSGVSARDRSRFQGKLDELVQAGLREQS